MVKPWTGEEAEALRERAMEKSAHLLEAPKILHFAPADIEAAKAAAAVRSETEIATETLIGVASVGFRMALTNPWRPVSDLFEILGPHVEQADVFFGSPEWGWPILGMVTRMGDVLEWSLYDQENDKWLPWGSTPPTLWCFSPKLPPMKSE